MINAVKKVQHWTELYLSFYEAAEAFEIRKPEDFLKFLDQFEFESFAGRSNQCRISNYKNESGQRWPDFFAGWRNRLTKARGDFWDNKNKISVLQTALNGLLITTIAGNHLYQVVILITLLKQWIKILSNLKCSRQEQEAIKPNRINSLEAYYWSLFISSVSLATKSIATTIVNTP